MEKRRLSQLKFITAWGLLFGVLLVAIWTVTQYQQAPRLILLALLFLITINFSLPPGHSAVSLVPIVSVGSLLVLGLLPALFLLVGSVLLAAVVAPLWAPLWEASGISPAVWSDRLLAGLVQLLALAVSALVFRQLGGLAPLNQADGSDLYSFIGLSISYGVTYLLGTAFLWRTRKMSWRQFPLLLTMALGFGSHPIAFLGGITYARNGLPAFVIYCLSMAVIAVIVWLSWQRSHLLRQRFNQLSVLNELGDSLRETLDLNTILITAGRQVLDLLAADSFSVVLAREGGQWIQYQISTSPETSQDPPLTVEPLDELDDLARWVAERALVLELHPDNWHFAARHQLSQPDPRPDAWLGVPMNASDQLIGVMVLQKYSPGFRFDRWSRELSLAIAGQTSNAIQNARLYDETVRLYDRTDAALSQRLKQLQALLDTMKEGVLMLDTDGHIALINPMAAALLGYQEAAALRNQRLPPETAQAIGFDRKTFSELTTELTSGNVPLARQTEFPAMAAAGSARSAIRRMLRTDAPVLDESNKILGWLMLFRDVTEEVELVELRTDLTRMIVHDLRNPLTTISSTIELARQYIAGGLQNSAETSLQLQSAMRSCSDMLDLIDSLMDISRIEAGQAIVQADAMRLPPLVERTADRLTPLVQSKGIDLRLQYSEDLPAVWADEELLRRVLVNLLDNSLKFSPAGGSIVISLCAEPASTPNREPGVRCTITDSGPGVPAQYRQEVFNHFVRAGPDGTQIKGTGLGLAFCRMVVEAHDGRIWIEDELPVGSRFVFVLPGIPIFDEGVDDDDD